MGGAVGNKNLCRMLGKSVTYWGVEQWDGRTDRHGCLIRKGKHNVATLALVCGRATFWCMSVLCSAQCPPLCLTHSSKDL